MKLQFCMLLLTSWLSAKVSAQTCFHGNRWVNCLLNTCTIYKKCPGDPTATCTIKRTECGCEANWYKASGEIAKCDVRRNHKLCPGGERVVRCNVDLCSWSCNHPGFVNAPCRRNSCGKCTAEYFVKEKWVACPSSVKGPPAEAPPLQTAAVMVPGKPCNFVPCNIKICINKKCPLEPRAVCRPDGCNECKPSWYLGDNPVQCHKGDKPLVPPKTLDMGQRACAGGRELVPCDQTICDKKICRNHPNAVCRPDGCGECKDTWYVGDKQVDCLSDDCPSNVPFFKCVDDPCKYFSHYCPDALCRASQCGKCEAKFYANGVEVDCAMPPKACPADVKPRNCKWFTCPSNICPSNKRLMCRIDPCGPTCRHDWVDIYNGEIMTCRTFDGNGRTIKQKSEKIFLQDPLLKFFNKPYTDKSTPDSNNMNPASNFFPEPQHPVSVITGRANTMVPDMKSQINVVVSRGPGRFRVEPIFVKPRQVLSKSDLYALLNAYEHELMGISSLSIQNALRNANILNGPFPLPSIPLTPVAPVNPSKLKAVDTEPSRRGLALPGILRREENTASIGIGSPFLVSDNSQALLDTASMLINTDTGLSAVVKAAPKINLEPGSVTDPNHAAMAEPFLHEKLAKKKLGIGGAKSQQGIQGVSLGQPDKPVGKPGILEPTFDQAGSVNPAGIQSGVFDLGIGPPGPLFPSTVQAESFSQTVNRIGAPVTAVDQVGEVNPAVDQSWSPKNVADQSGTTNLAVDGLETPNLASDRLGTVNQAAVGLGTAQPVLDQLRTHIPELDPFGMLGPLSENPGTLNSGSAQSEVLGPSLEQQGSVQPIIGGLESWIGKGGSAIGQNAPAKASLGMPLVDPPKTEKQISQPLGPRQASPGKAEKGVPISMHVLQQWGAN